MTKFLGYGYFATGQDAEGNVQKYYAPGEEMGDVDPATLSWAATQGLQFEPMPSNQQMAQAAMSVQQQATPSGVMGPPPPSVESQAADQQAAQEGTSTQAAATSGTAPAGPGV